VRREDREKLLTALSFLSGPTRVEYGCISCELFQDTANPNAFRLECEWKTEADLVRHVRSEFYKQLLSLMELGAKPPRVQFHSVSGTRGLEFIQSSRSGIEKQSPRN
jgi:quinol monooxygenase YgiN